MVGFKEEENNRIMDTVKRVLYAYDLEDVLDRLSLTTEDALEALVREGVIQEEDLEEMMDDDEDFEERDW